MNGDEWRERGSVEETTRLAATFHTFRKESRGSNAEQSRFRSSFSSHFQRQRVCKLGQRGVHGLLGLFYLNPSDAKRLRD